MDKEILITLYEHVMGLRDIAKEINEQIGAITAESNALYTELRDVLNPNLCKEKEDQKDLLRKKLIEIRELETAALEILRENVNFIPDLGYIPIITADNMLPQEIKKFEEFVNRIKFTDL